MMSVSPCTAANYTDPSWPLSRADEVAWSKTACYFLSQPNDSACLKKRLARSAFFLCVPSSPPVNNPACPGLSVETPHKYPPCFSKRPSSGTVSGANTTPAGRTGKKRNKQFHPAGWLVVKFQGHSIRLPLAASGPRTFWWISAVFYTCGKSTTLFRQVPPDR